MAQPEICELAKQMWEVYSSSIPSQLKEGQWHLPFLNENDILDALNSQEDVEESVQKLIKRSVARCARVSYLNHDGTNATESQDLQLYDRLLGSQPVHASPAEHQAQAVWDPTYKSGNFRGWCQYRQTIIGQNITEFTGPTNS